MSMESDGLCLGYPKMIAYGVTNSGRYNSPPLEFKLVLELAKWLLWIYWRIFPKLSYFSLGS
jgi:hypothetical protein